MIVKLDGLLGPVRGEARVTPKHEYSAQYLVPGQIVPTYRNLVLGPAYSTVVTALGLRPAAARPGAARVMPRADSFPWRPGRRTTRRARPVAQSRSQACQASSARSRWPRPWALAAFRSTAAACPNALSDPVFLRSAYRRVSLARCLCASGGTTCWSRCAWKLFPNNLAQNGSSHRLLVLLQERFQRLIHHGLISRACLLRPGAELIENRVIDVNGDARLALRGD